eukprot:7428647-Lingulodinium_polyedra.AAC.1
MESLPKGPASKGMKKGSKTTYPEKIPSRIPQSEAKIYMPPDSSLWRGLVRSEWCAHVRPHPRFSEPWKTSGEHDALIRIYRKAWRLHLQREGLAESQCPIKGIFLPEPVPQA